MVSDEELHRRLVKGEISDEQYFKGIEKNCKHKPDIEELGDGRWIEWCENCGKKLGSGYNPNLVGAGSAKTVKVKGGCAVVALLIIGTVAAGLYGVAELVL